jgi:hypothetical protein
LPVLPRFEISFLDGTDSGHEDSKERQQRARDFDGRVPRALKERIRCSGYHAVSKNPARRGCVVGRAVVVLFLFLLSYDAADWGRAGRPRMARRRPGPSGRTPAVATTLRRGLFTTERLYVKPPCPSVHTSYSQGTGPTPGCFPILAGLKPEKEGPTKR